MPQHRHFSFPDSPPDLRYRLLSGAVVPRPIALVTTVDAAGRPNAAPFSFFGVLSHDPATLALGIDQGDDGQMKDTARNIRATGMLTVHIVDAALAAQMAICASPLAPGVSELALAGLDTVPGRDIAVPRIATAPIALECRLLRHVDLGPARSIVLAEVLGLFVREGAVNDRGHIDPEAVDAIARLGGRSYATTRDTFVL